jgi:hypothetical protein
MLPPPPPIQQAVFLETAEELLDAAATLAWLAVCAPAVVQQLSVALVAPVAAAVGDSVLGSGTAAANVLATALRDAEARHVLESGTSGMCLRPPAQGARPQNYARQAPYPNNLLRNVAWQQSSTPFVLVLDIDVFPFPASLASRFQQMVAAEEPAFTKAHAEQRVYVVPVFELDGTLAEDVADKPDSIDSLASFDKAKLQHLWDQGRVRPFYFELCPHCHAPTQFRSTFF